MKYLIGSICHVLLISQLLSAVNCWFVARFEGPGETMRQLETPEQVLIRKEATVSDITKRINV